MYPNEDLTDQCLIHSGQLDSPVTLFYAALPNLLKQMGPTWYHTNCELLAWPRGGRPSNAERNKTTSPVHDWVKCIIWLFVLFANELYGFCLKLVNITFDEEWVP